MTDTALYYTFSTIAQALAGAFGVLAAFAILAWTRIEADIHDGQAAMFDLKNPGSDALWDKAVASGVDQVVKEEFSKLTDDDVASDPRWRRVRRGVAAVPQKETLYCRLTAAWVPTAIDIGLSIVLIPFVPMLACSTTWSFVSSAVTIVFALVCLGFYGAVVLVTIPRETW